VIEAGSISRTLNSGITCKHDCCLVLSAQCRCTDTHFLWGGGKKKTPGATIMLKMSTVQNLVKQAPGFVKVNQSRYRPGVALRVPRRFPDFMTTAQGGGKVVSHTHRLHLPPGNPPGTHFC